ncbi:S8 family serine peptidase [Archangium gephyra]|uniref:S8 family serine peptidase n=1 Tax=Archangium gephyra TaxID=48 RepID=UPI0035D4B803
MQKPIWRSPLLTTLLAVLPAYGSQAPDITEPSGKTLGAALSAPSSQVPSVSASSAKAYDTDRIIVRYHDQAAARKTPSAAMVASRIVQRAASRHGLIAQQLHTTGQGAQVWAMNRHMTNDEAQALAKQIAAADPEVEYAEPDYILRATWTPNDSLYSSQWHYFETTAGINLPAAWDRTNGAGVVVAVVDTGYRPHADLAANLLPGYDFITQTTVSNDGDGRDSDARDPGDLCPTSTVPKSSWHGTHVAGTIGAVTNNGTGVAGVAYGAKILPVRVLGKCGGYTSDIADGVRWASGNTVTGVPANPTPARVINMSLGGSGTCSQTMQDAITAARNKGTVVVAAAGNDSQDASGFFPANCRGVVAVAAVDRGANRAWFSNYGFTVSLAAPGDPILSTLNDGQDAPGNDSYASYYGTSMAAPHVAGTAALMLSANPSLAVDTVARLLQSTTRLAGTCSGCGTGIVNAAVAVNESIASGTTNHINESAFFVQQTYFDVLKRKPDAGGEAYHVGLLNACNGASSCLASTRAAIARSLLESSEYRAQDPWDPASPMYNLYFIDRCYWRFLQRSALMTEAQFWLDYLNATGDYNGVVNGFITSPEYRKRFGTP